MKAIGYALIYNAAMFGAALLSLLLPGGKTVARGVIGFCLGAALGSFLNLLVYRLRAGIPISGPPSHCPRCKTPIKDRHNIPVFSWLWLRGRCASCGNRISWHYPAVELASGCVGTAIVIGVFNAIA